MLVVMSQFEHNYGRQSNHYADAESDEQAQEEIFNLPAIRDHFYMVFSLIVIGLPNSSVQELALSEKRMYQTLVPELERRKAEYWSHFRTPRQEGGLEQLVPLLCWSDEVESVTEYLCEAETICITGCCSESFFQGHFWIDVLEFYKRTLRVGDRVICYGIHIDGSMPLSQTLEVVEAKTCLKHPVQFGLLQTSATSVLTM